MSEELMIKAFMICWVSFFGFLFGLILRHPGPAYGCLLLLGWFLIIPTIAAFQVGLDTEGLIELGIGIFWLVLGFLAKDAVRVIRRQIGKYESRKQSLLGIDTGSKERHTKGC